MITVYLEILVCILFWQTDIFLIPEYRLSSHQNYFPPDTVKNTYHIQEHAFTKSKIYANSRLSPNQYNVVRTDRDH